MIDSVFMRPLGGRSAEVAAFKDLVCVKDTTAIHGFDLAAVCYGFEFVQKARRWRATFSRNADEMPLTFQPSQEPIADERWRGQFANEKGVLSFVRVLVARPKIELILGGGG